MRARGFELLCEIEPPTTPDFRIVREQIAVLAPVCDAFLVPDNHLGRATVSSIAVAHEVGYLQERAIACINARDRNLLGFERDLLTATAHGVDEFLFVYGDRASRGERSTLRVRDMLGEVRARREATDGARFRVGVTADVRRPLPRWKHGADFVVTQLSLEADAVQRWREASGFDGAVYAGVVVLASEKMARRLADMIPGFDVPTPVFAALAQDPRAGVDLAVEQISTLRTAGIVDGVHLVPGRRYRQLAEALEQVADRS